MLSMESNEQQDSWDELFPHVEPASNNSVNASTGLAPNEIYIGRLSRLPISVFSCPNISGYQSLDRDHLAYCNLSAERQQRAYCLVHEHHAVTAARLTRRSNPIMDALRRSPLCTMGGWAWVYNSVATIRRDAKKDTDTTVLETKLSLN